MIFLVNEISLKKGFSIDINVLIYLHLWHKNYYTKLLNYKNNVFHAKMCLDNNFYLDKFIYLFLLQNPNSFVLKPPSLKDGSFKWKDRWLLPLFLFFPILGIMRGGCHNVDIYKECQDFNARTILYQYMASESPCSFAENFPTLTWRVLVKSKQILCITRLIITWRNK